MTPATVQAGTEPLAVTVDPSGRYAYVANSDDDNVSQYAIDTDGTLVPMATDTVPAGDAPVAVAVDPSGRYVYVANELGDDVSQYAIDANDGSLSALSPATVAAGDGPVSVTVDPRAGMLTSRSGTGASRRSQSGPMAT